MEKSTVIGIVLGFVSVFVGMSYVSTAGIRSEDTADDRRQELIDACMPYIGGEEVLNLEPEDEGADRR